jgi:hypothetical protein
MKPDSEHERIRALFRGLRREDERQAPPFAHVCQQASTGRRATVPRIVWRIAAAAALVVLVGVGAAILSGRGPWARPGASQAPPVVQAPAPRQFGPTDLWISRWESPTAFLLEPPTCSSTGAGYT